MKENAFENSEREPRPYQIFHTDKVYGVGEDGKILDNANIIVNPDGLIESIEAEGSEKLADPKFDKAVKTDHEVIIPALTDAHNHPLVFPSMLESSPAFIFSKIAVISIAAVQECVNNVFFVLAFFSNQT